MQGRCLTAIAVICTISVVHAELASAAESRTLRLATASLTVPGDCETVKATASIVRCRAENADGSAFFASIDLGVFDPWSAEAAARDLGVAAPPIDSAAQNVDVAFRQFAAKTVTDVKHRITAGDIPRARLPAGAYACKVYTIQQFGIAPEIGDMTIFERGVFCITLAPDFLHRLHVAAAVHAYHPGRGQTLPKDAATRLDRVLATFRLR